VRQTLAIPAQVRVWQEDEDPIALIAGALKERGLSHGTVGIEETVRFFASDGLGRLMPGITRVSANPVVRGCRMIKTPAEIALMTSATQVTIAAYRWVWPRIREGMGPHEIGALMNAATVKLGGKPEFALVLLGEAAAYPHGSREPQRVREGEVVLMDCGCTVQGYQSDVSRTFVPGKAPAEVRKVWETVHEGQQVAFRTARLGLPAGQIDDAVRVFYEKQGLARAIACRVCRIAPAMASGWTGMSRSISFTMRRRRWRRVCASRMSRGFICPASSACGWRIASI
jgi:Xaa-Pro dipeptidase